MKRVPDYVKYAAGWRAKDARNFTKACKIIERRLKNRIVAKRPATERKHRRGFKGVQE